MFDAGAEAQLGETSTDTFFEEHLLIGFGKHTSTGIGLFLDLGAAFIGEPVVSLDATGNSTLIGTSEFQAELRKQEINIENDLGSYIKVWPIINIGLRIGVGGS